MCRCGNLADVGGRKLSRTLQLCSLYLALTAVLSASTHANAARSYGVLECKHPHLPLVSTTGNNASVAVKVAQTGNQTAPSCSNVYVSISSHAGPVKNQQVAAAIQGVFKTPHQTSAITITSILQNEAPYGLHQHDKCPDAQINGGSSFSVRVEHPRSYEDIQAKPKGRTYFISFTARSTAGSCNGVATMCLPEGSDCHMHHNEALFDSMSCSLFPFRRVDSLNWSSWQSALDSGTV